MLLCSVQTGLECRFRSTGGSVSPGALTRRILSCRATGGFAVRYIEGMESLDDTHVDWPKQLTRGELPPFKDPAPPPYPPSKRRHKQRQL
jgi:hypothetical protein